MSDENDSAEVVVVGAGPAGLTAAATLASYGVQVLVVEKRATGPELPKATVASTRTMELMRGLGVAEAVRAGADDVSMTLLEIRTAREAGAGTEWDVGYPSAEQAAVLSPERPACVPQDHLEGVLLDLLARNGSARLRRGLTVDAVRDLGGGVRVETSTPSGARRTVEAGWVIGADGAWSAVRRSLGIGFRGPTDAMRGAQLELRAPLWDVVGPHRHLIYSVTREDAQGILLPAGQGDRWVYASELALDDPVPDAATLLERARLAAGVPGLPMTALRHRHVTIGAQIATTFSAGRVLLAGDAAHRVTPRGGTGLNTAVAGAHDLAWKLAWVVRGWALPSLLDSYERERRVVAEHNVARSLDPFGTRRRADQEIAADLGGRVRHLWLDDAGATSTLDVLGPGLTVLAGPARRAAAPGRVRTPAGAAAPPSTTVSLTALQARALGVPADGALLLRPDGVPAHDGSLAAAS